jgi:hypothetical protein
MKKQIQQIIEEMKTAQSGAARPAKPQEAEANLLQEPQTNPPQEETNPTESSEPEKACSQ